MGIHAVKFGTFAIEDNQDELPVRQLRLPQSAYIKVSGLLCSMLPYGATCMLRSRFSAFHVDHTHWREKWQNHSNTTGESWQRWFLFRVSACLSKTHTHTHTHTSARAHTHQLPQVDLMDCRAPNQIWMKTCLKPFWQKRHFIGCHLSKMVNTLSLPRSPPRSESGVTSSTDTDRPLPIAMLSFYWLRVWSCTA